MMWPTEPEQLPPVLDAVRAAARSYAGAAHLRDDDWEPDLSLLRHEAEAHHGAPLTRADVEAAVRELARRGEWRWRMNRGEMSHGEWMSLSEDVILACRERAMEFGRAIGESVDFKSLEALTSTAASYGTLFHPPRARTAAGILGAGHPLLPRNRAERRKLRRGR